MLQFRLCFAEKTYGKEEEGEITDEDIPPANREHYRQTNFEEEKNGKECAEAKEM